MQRLRIRYFCGILTIILACGFSRGLGGEKYAPRLLKALAAHPAAGNLTVWIFFADKGEYELFRTSVPLSVVSPASVRRRQNVLPPDGVVDYSDLPVEQAYANRIRSLGLTIRQVSKWFNGVSAIGTPAQLAAVAELPWVSRMDLVARYAKRPGPAPEITSPSGQPSARKTESPDTPDYGPCIGQLNQMNVPPIHAMGNHAEGVIVGVFDNGVRLLSHQAFDSLRTRIIGTHDFVDHKTSVIPNDTSTSLLEGTFGTHGVETLSTIGGYFPGQQIGPAYGASFILARTENDSSETPIEEDNWVAAIEWADSLGVQVTSTSLGYLGFDSPYTSLTWQDMNGRTAIISIAATMAARKGIVVCNAAGNNHQSQTHNTLDAPADADSILSVGAVDEFGSLASFSSCGPTVDGRIKPDVLAQGVRVHVASSVDTSGYRSNNGTSFACPLAAGVVALLVKAYPHATPMEIINALRNTANNAAAPTNYVGWGIINALAAFDALGTGEVSNNPGAYSLSQNFPNPFNQTTVLTYRLLAASLVKLVVYDLLGREVTVLVHSQQDPGIYRVTFDGTKLASGVYFYRMEGVDTSGQTQRLVRKMVLLR